ncbi:MAG: TonB-dependent receptor [Pseudomonadota bacterium]|nr:TonB-dependent receptor [Pseudomonadota bacterium]
MKIVLMAACVAAPFCASAETAKQLDPVIVTATGQPTAIGNTLAPILVLTREQIEQSQALDLAELLRFYAGIEIGRSGGSGAQTAIFIRGGESNHTLVLIDGVRVNPATSGGAAVQNIAPDMIERIEIVKGPRATLYGSDAIGGVINVITRGSASTGADLSLRGGSDSSYDGSLRGSWANEQGSLSLQAQHLQTDGYPALAGETQDTGYDRTSFNVDGDLKIGKASIGARVWDAVGTTDYYGYAPDFSRTVLSQDYRNLVAALDVTLPFSSALSGTLRVSRGEDDSKQQQSDDFVETVRTGVDGNLVWRGEHQRLTTAISAIREEVEALSFGTETDETRDILTLSLQDEIGIGRHHAVLGATWADYDGFGDRVDGSLEYGFDVTGNGRLVAAASTGFRAPDATDRFGFGGNPDLKPESAQNLELGWQQRIGDAQRIDLRVFRSEVDDLINVLCDADFNCTAVNVDKFRNEGVELTWNIAIVDWTATLTGLLQDPKDLSTDTQLLRRAKRTAALRLNRQFGRWNAGLDLLGSGSRPDFDRELGGYALLNLGGGVKIGTQTRVNLRVENVLDKDYQTSSGYNQAGASFYLGIAQGF